MAVVRVPPGVDVLIDDCDVGLMISAPWTAHLSHGYWRVTARTDRRTLVLSREIVRRKRISVRGRVVDHMNGDTLDNRRENLRSTTPVFNSRNLGGPHRDNSSPYLGVNWHQASGKWQARITVAAKSTYLGLFDTLEDANRARLAAEAKLWGVQPRRASAHQALAA